MQAILKAKHQKFCDWVQNIKTRQPVADHRLSELENELKALYLNYQQKREELRQVINTYEEKQKAIKIEIKKNRRGYGLFQ